MKGSVEETHVKPNSLDVIKFLLVGDSNVGKSCLLLRYIDDTFTPSFISTIGIDFKVKTIQLTNGKEVKVQIWDTAGQERFRTITSAYYRGAMGLVIVYDITSKDSFDHVPYWMDEVRTNANRDPVKVLVGNKSDMVEGRVIGETQGRTYAQQMGYLFSETSAKSGKNVKELFVELAEKVYAKETEQTKETETITLDSSTTKKENKSCC